MSIRFVGRPQGQAGVIVTPQSSPPPGHRPAGPLPMNGASVRDFIAAKAGIGADGSRGFYTGSLRDFLAGRGVVK